MLSLKLCGQKHVQGQKDPAEAALAVLTMAEAQLNQMIVPQSLLIAAVMATVKVAATHLIVKRLCAKDLRIQTLGETGHPPVEDQDQWHRIEQTRLCLHGK